MSLSIEKRIESYFETGQFYIVKNSFLKKDKKPFEIKTKSNLFITPDETFIDIDNESQFKMGQMLYNALYK